MPRLRRLPICPITEQSAIRGQLHTSRRLRGIVFNGDSVLTSSSPLSSRVRSAGNRCNGDKSETGQFVKETVVRFGRFASGVRSETRGFCEGVCSMVRERRFVIGARTDRSVTPPPGSRSDHFSSLKHLA